jgi:hypothetical protein
VTPGWSSISSLLVAAALSPEHMNLLCEGVFGTTLKGITTATDPQQQADAIVDYAARYNLMRELADMIMRHASNRPAVQNLLLSDDMQLDSQSGNIQNQLQTLTVRMDRVLELQMAQAAENAEMQRWRNATDQRLRSVESAVMPDRGPHSVSLPGGMMVVVMALLVAGMFAFVLWPRL